MGTKDLFDKGKPYKVLKSSDLQGVSEKAESAKTIETAFERKNRFIPRVDYSDTTNFVRFGSAKKYYEDAVDRITNSFPYDGSESELNQFYNSSSYFDLYILDKEYPRTTGYISISADGWGTAGTNKSGWTATNTPEYIVIRGGPHTASGGMPSGSLGLSFSASNIYDTDIYNTERIFQGLKTGTRASNLRYALSAGVTFEFWMNKTEFLAGSGKKEKEVIFDLWNGVTDSGSADYGRFLLYLTGSGLGGANTGGTGSVRLMYASGTTTSDVDVFTSDHTTASYIGSGWHHYAVALQNSGSDLLLRSYFDGSRQNTLAISDSTLDEVTGSLKAYIGALQTAPSGNAFASDGAGTPLSMGGYAKLSASLDEVRYWKTYRTAEDIGLNYIRQVRGGSNADISNADLGVYFKFNEGITTSSSVDSIVLDYGGRISNGNWVGYPSSNARNTGSAMVSASVVGAEFEDPIVRGGHPTVVSVRSTLIDSGSVFDYTNNSSIFGRMPSWIIDEDPGTLAQMTQIMGSYFDSLHLQLEELPYLKDLSYISSSYKTIPFANRIVSTYGMDAPEIFADADILAQIMNRDEKRNFELDLAEVKNRIYKNIYNNLVYIYKTKGTNKSFRNLIRCYGVDDEIIKLSLYGNNITYKLRSNYEKHVSRKKYIDFNNPDSFAGVVTQQSASDVNLATYPNASNVSFISGTVDTYIPTTSEIEVIFPKKTSDRGNLAWFNTDFLSSSICGTHRLKIDGVSNSAYEQAATANDYSWSLYAVRDDYESPDAHFVFKSNRGSTPDFYLTSSLYTNLYDNQKWNFAVRTVNVKYPVADGTSGSYAGSDTDFDIDDTYLKLELYGLNYEAGILKNELVLTSSAMTASAYLTADHRYYIGADRVNWTGSVNERTDIRASSLRHWESYLENAAIHAHAKDPDNFGSLNPYRSTYLLQTALTGAWVPQMETLALHWNFENVTGSDSKGEFLVDDYSSGSTGRFDRYSGHIGGDKFSRTLAYQYPGQGLSFETSTTGVVERAYVDGLKLQPPESLNSYDTISVLTMQDDVQFTRDSRPVNYFYAFEKSMYRTITEEIMNFFGSIVEFNNLIGDPKNRYRQSYKELEKLRELFFERIRNTPDLDKYIEYYKWIDNSLSVMLQQLVPASADFSDGIRTMVESHALERNKYWSKFPTLEMKVTDPEAAVRGITELKYDWKHGHAPLKVTATYTDAMDFNGFTTGTDRVSITVPISAGGVGSAIAIALCNDTNGGTSAGSGVIGVGTSGASAGTVAEAVIDAINGTTNGRVHFGSGTSVNGVVGVKATLSGTTKVSLAAALEGVVGNGIVVANVAGDAATAGSLSGGYDNEAEKCLWWHDRAERTNVTISSSVASVNTDRGSILTITETYRTGSPGPTLAKSTRTLPTTTYEGSTYAVRRFDEIYNFVVDESPLYHGGPDYSQRKRYGFITPQIRTVPKGHYQILTVIKDPEYGKVCDDAIVPPELDKKKVEFAYQPFAGNNINLEENDYTRLGIGDIYAPFSLYSSSVTTGYVAAAPYTTGRELFDVVSGGIENYHHDIVGNDMDVPMQGPFTEKYVGGNQHRHQDLVYDPATTGSSNISNRAEAWNIRIQTDNTLGLAGRKHSTVMGHPWAVWKRDATAKRPVNIQNIQMTASDIGVYKTTLPSDAVIRSGPTPTEFISGTLRSNIGNFENFYEIVQTSGRDINNNYLVNNDGITASAITSTDVTGVVDYAKPLRGKNEHIFVERFSAPGGPEVAGDANGGYYLDLESAQYSPYNALPWRNATVREPLNKTFLVNHTNQFGFYSNTQEIADGRVATATKATYVDAMDFNGFTTNTDRVSITVPTNAGGEGSAIAIALCNDTDGSTSAGSGVIGVGTSGASAGTVAEAVIDAINGVTNGRVHFGSGTSVNGVVGVAASLSSTTKVTLTARDAGNAGNFITVANVAGDAATAGSLSGGEDTGASTVSAADYSGTGSYHKANRNTLKRPELSGTTGPASAWSTAVIVTGAVYDNYYVTHEIPQMETSYAWISASYTSSHIYGHGHPNGFYSSSNDGNIASINFVSASELGSWQHGAGDRRYVRDFYWVVDNSKIGFVPTVAHLNTNIVEPMTASEAILGYQIKTSSAGNTTHVGYYVNYKDIDSEPHNVANNESFINKVSNYTIVTASILHDLLVHRGGIYGYPSWRQTRTGENQLVRYYRKNNTITINPMPGPSLTLGDGAIVTNAFGSLQSFYEPPVDNSSKPLQITLGVKTKIGNTFQTRPCVLETPYGNELLRFSNRALEELVTIGEEVLYTPYDTIKKTYLNGALEDPTTPVQRFVSLRYRETIYPASYNAGLEKIRERQNFKVKFWDTTRAKRTTLGSEKSSSMGAPYYGFDWHQLTQSAWALDASAIFDTGPICTASNASSSAAGELQNDYLMVHNGARQFITASALYARKHMLPATGSTISLTLDNPQTGSFAPTIPTLTQGNIAIGGGTALWEADRMAGRIALETVETLDSNGNPVAITAPVFKSEPKTPIDPNYESYMKNAILQSQDYSIIPEFRISEHIDKYLKNASTDWLIDNPRIFSIFGASGTLPQNSSDTDFYKIYANSDFMKHFELIHDDHKSFKSPAKLTLKCKVIKKFLPYDGFYPAQRTLDLASQFSQSYGRFVNTEGGVDYINAADGNAIYTDAIDLASFTIGDVITITVPVDAGGTGVAMSIVTEGVDATGANSTTSTAIGIGCSSAPGDGTVAETIVDAINGFFGSGGAYNHAFASANSGVNTGVVGVTATLSGTTKISLKADLAGSPGNGITVANTTGNAATAGSFSGANDALAYRQAALRPFLAPFFAPGIMYNTIKSGIAVDYGTYSGSYAVEQNTSSAGGGGELFFVGRPTAINGNQRFAAGDYAYGFDNRVPFEALVTPADYVSNMTFVDMEPHPSASMNLTASWNGSGDPLYEMMINNFLAESVNMFLPNGQMSTIISAKESEFLPFRRKQIYGMRIRLRKSLNKARTYNVDLTTGEKVRYPVPNITNAEITNDKIRESFTMYSRPSAFGPPLCGRQMQTVDIATRKADPLSGVNPAYTPPYYDGEAWCDVIFRAEYETHTLKEILANANFLETRIDNGVWSKAGDGANDYAMPYDRFTANRYAMQLSSSINTKGAAKVNAVEYTPEGAPSLIIDSPDTAEAVWVIQPRFETPMFNFCSTSGSFRPITEADGNLTMPANGKTTVPRGMWHQFGLPPDSNDKGIFLEISDIPTSWVKGRLPDAVGQTAEDYYQTEVAADGMRSLMDQVKFQRTGIRLGEVAESFEVSEAVVAVPFFEKDGVRNFFGIPRRSVGSYLRVLGAPVPAEFVGADIAKIDAADGGVLLDAVADPELDVGDSIKDQIDIMQKYVIPPKFNFLEFPSVEPMVMYIFEFKHTFDRNDLGHMWQNLPPRASSKIEMAENTISHPLLVNELMGATGATEGRALQKEVQWMVFKVKQKANWNYYDKVLSRVGGDKGFSFSFSLGGAKTEGEISDIKYSYNWPYDFFSLVEFANIEADVSFERPPDNVPNLGYIPEPTEEDSDKFGSEPPPTPTTD